ncbi:MAG: NADH-quinone oxidoreductase subunit N [Candidatus Thalassarchaeaceae archaeon]|jgi:NADH:ubiquinone oxidoreductase subunit 2 (subunit N)|nr:NADH-quinone oxidoreductase subunit N [Candidatus Thalassarchaeaceae archaeon]
MLTIDEMENLLPEMALVLGIILAIFVPNIGNATFRIPLTRIRVPILIGGKRYKMTSDPRLPGRMSITVFSVALLFSFFGIEGASGEIGGVIEISSFSRMMSVVFFGSLLLAAVATTYRMPARPSARAPRERDTESRAEALVAALMDNRRQVDFHLLLMMVGLGMSLMAMASNLFFMFVAIELTSLAAYILVAFHKEEAVGGEAGAKYFIVGSVSSATGIYGMSLVYLWSGDLDFDALAAAWAAMDGLDPFAVIGVGLMLVAFGFKVSAAPFHLAAPDAYAGASSPVAGLLATASKAMGFVALFRVLIEVTMPEEGEALWFCVLALIAIVTMTWGNLAALTSENPKRMLAYSSVAHAGYMLAALAAVGSGLGDASTTKLVLIAIVFHLTILVLFKFGAFLVLGLLETEGRSHRLEDLHGLARRDPLIAGSMFIFMLSLAGVPPLSGFLSKLLMINGIVNISAGTGSTTADAIVPWAETVDPVFWLAIAIVLNSALSLFYYLRLCLVMFFEEPDVSKPLRRAGHLRRAIIVLAVLSLFFGIGAGAEFLLELVETAVAAM